MEGAVKQERLRLHQGSSSTTEATGSGGDATMEATWASTIIDDMRNYFPVGNKPDSTSTSRSSSRSRRAATRLLQKKKKVSTKFQAKPTISCTRNYRAQLCEDWHELRPARSSP